jgi:hypothetical protein
MLQVEGGKRGLNKTKDERKRLGFKAESESPKPKRNKSVSYRCDDNGTQPKKGPKVGKFDPSDPSSKKFKGGNRDKSEPLEKVRYQQISVTALGNLTSNSSKRILQ